VTNQERWASDPIAFITEVLRNPGTGRAFELYPKQERFLREALTPTEDGVLPFAELVYSAPKKSGKTATAAMAQLYVVVALGGPYAEGYVIANDYEQAQGRVFQAVARIVESSPLLRRTAKLTSNRIEFSSGATITAISSDYSSAAGANPNISSFDELWGYTSERSHRLWDEMVPVPTRNVSVRLTTTYAGFEGESDLLWNLYKRGLRGDQEAKDLYCQPGMLTFWTHQPVAPWQTQQWLEQMRGQLRPNAYLRMIENRFVSGDEQFIPVEWWDRAATSTPVVADRKLQVVLGVDASTKRDASAVVACSWDAATKRVRVVAHKVFVPGKEALDLEETLEAAVRDLAQRFNLIAILFDPWQFQRSAQTLAKAGLPMVEYPQSPPNLTAMSTNLYELLQGGNLIAYPDAGIRLAIQRAVAVDVGRGQKISKEKASHRIDVVVAMAMAALGAVERASATSSPEAIASIRTLMTELNPTRRSALRNLVGSPGTGWFGYDRLNS
jgi:phage terminase large subunit-like protein